MGGGIMQLVAYGAQDIYLTGNPQITFFKVVYRRHTNFSMETIQQTIEGTSATSQSSTTNGTVTISRNGDLVYKVYVHVNLVDENHHLAYGLAIVNQVELEIGGQTIDKHTQGWNEIYSELFIPSNKDEGYATMVGTGHAKDRYIYIPLNFWFCRNPGLALPLIALQYHEVKLKFTWGTTEDLQNGIGITPHTTPFSPEVWCDYIYLDTDERRRFAQVSHEYLIEQLQSQTTSATTNQKLIFNHPVKELIWTSTHSNSQYKVKLTLNGHDRFAKQDESYFQLRQPYEYHSAVPHVNCRPTEHQHVDSHLNTDTETWTLVATPGDVVAGKIHIFYTDDQTSTPKKKLGHYVKPGASEWSPNGFVLSSVLNECTANDHFVYITYNRNDLPLKKSKGMYNSNKTYHITNSASTDSDKDFNMHVTLPGLKSADTGIGVVAFNQYLTIIQAQLSTRGKGGAGGKIATATAGQTLTIKTTNIAEQPKTHNKTYFDKLINVYSFALKPENHQPSGTCNFSRIDNAMLISDGHEWGTDNTIYAINYNVLRIMSGMGGLAYSN